MDSKYNVINADVASRLIRSVYQKSITDNSEYWHYTSAKAVLEIFKDHISSVDTGDGFVRNCTFLASNIRYMNDFHEFMDGIETYKDCCEDANVSNALKKESDFHMDNIFLISFCGNGDLLSQWKWYGKDSGVSIKFEFSNAEIGTMDPNEFKKQDYNDPSNSTERPYACADIRPYPVKYQSADKQAYFKDLINTPVAQNCDQPGKVIPLAFVPFCKDEGFEEEAESRLVFFAINPLDNSTNFKYNSFEQGRIKPALKVFITHRSAYTPLAMDSLSPYRPEKKKPEDMIVPAKNIISQIIVGPGVNQNLVFNLLIHIFDRKNYYFHDEDENISEKKRPLSSSDFQEQSGNTSPTTYRELHYVKWNVNKLQRVRASYLCENGIVIMKSATPFRG